VPVTPVPVTPVPVTPVPEAPMPPGQPRRALGQLARRPVSPVP